MNIVILTIILISFLNNVSSISSNYGNQIKNNYLKLVLFSNKKNIKMLKELNNFYKICYNKSISCIGQGITDYNNLTEDEKQIVEVIISLCY